MEIANPNSSGISVLGLAAAAMASDIDIWFTGDLISSFTNVLSKSGIRLFPFAISSIEGYTLDASSWFLIASFINVAAVWTIRTLSSSRFALRVLYQSSLRILVVLPRSIISLLPSLVANFTLFMLLFQFHFYHPRSVDIVTTFVYQSLKFRYCV